ncbi:MAG: capsid protein [Cressdnaviricota sp.]|nr:MAG: capsid protein [Cressdnaviricota sp.]
MARPRNARKLKARKTPYHRSAAFKARQRHARAAQRVRPRRALKTSPGSAPNAYNFKRTYDHPFLLGSTQGGDDSAFSLNADGKFQIMQFHTKFKYLPKFDTFKDVFSQYKIYSITHRMVPYYSKNMPLVTNGATGNHITEPIPNYEVFIIPDRNNMKRHEFAALTGDEITEFLNCSQRKARKLMPAVTCSFSTKNPKVVGYNSAVDKDGGAAATTMEAPSWYRTDPTPINTGDPNQTNITHYTTQALIRRVDGLAINTSGQQQMGFRIETDVYFKLRTVV